MIKAQNDSVIIKVDKPKDTKDEGGILLPNAQVDKPNTATVISISNRYYSYGRYVECYVDEGDKIIFDAYAGLPITYKGEDYLVIKVKDIFAVIDD
ncbi:MAG: GroES chaperonin family protein [Bacteriophage sp.]|nr:MAG: GroES chaperonin family protein [Bacteriophage sp.]